MQSSTRLQFKPKLLSIFRRGYSLADLRCDLSAGLTVAIVALPLAMALGVASGATPSEGLITAIVAGFLISLLGGSRVQIGGPTGAFVVIILSVIQQYGYDGLLLSTLLAGLILIAAGYLRLGQIIKFIPHPVVIGFTAGIAVILVSTQMKEFFGPSMGLTTPLVGVSTLALILLLRQWNPRIPGYLIALLASSLAVALLGLPVDTIGSRFSHITSSIPLPQLPDLSFTRIEELLPPAFTIAFLAGIEALLSAHVADGMSGYKHRPNQELVGQGVANIFSALFGGLPATGAIARTATNVASGARSPMAGIFHALFLLLFVLFASPLMLYVPLTSLAAILLLVAWRMSEPHQLLAIAKIPGSDRALCLLTLLLTVFVDLSVAIAVGISLASLLFVLKMSKSVEIAPPTEDSYQRQRLPPGVEVFQITGPIFFGMASDLPDLLKSIEPPPRLLILRMQYVPFLDGTGAAALKSLVRQCQRLNTKVLFSGLKKQPHKMLSSFEGVLFAPNFEEALQVAEAELGTSTRQAS